MDRRLLMRRILTTLVVSASIVAVVAAQRSTSSTEPLDALLNEVRQLRLAMERATVISPRIQLLTGRLSVQDQRVARLSHDVSALKDQMGRVATNVQQLAKEAAEIEEVLSRDDMDVKRRRELEGHQRALKAKAETLAAEDQMLRARETEAENALSAEQAAWADLVRRLDELEQALGQIR
jgi:chromosome segregation ATPase